MDEKTRRPAAVLDDARIIELFFARDEAGLGEMKRKYGAFLRGLAFNILRNAEDGEECENDTLLQAWSRIPPDRPANLRAYHAVMLRRIALGRIDRDSAEKRGGGVKNEALEDFEELIASRESVEDALENDRLRKLIDAWLDGCSSRRHYIFVARYCYSYPLDAVAKTLGCSRSTVNKDLAAMKKELRALLEREEFDL